MQGEEGSNGHWGSAREESDECHEHKQIKQQRNNEPGGWIWEVPIDRVWTNPRQPWQGLRDPLMEDIDELLA